MNNRHDFRHNLYEGPTETLNSSENTMGNEINYNHRHQASGAMISGSPDGYLTVKDVRDAIAHLPDDAEVVFGTCEHGEPLQFGRFKMRGPNLLQIEFG